MREVAIKKPDIAVRLFYVWRAYLAAAPAGNRCGSERADVYDEPRCHRHSAEQEKYPCVPAIGSQKKCQYRPVYERDKYLGA